MFYTAINNASSRERESTFLKQLNTRSNVYLTLGIAITILGQTRLPKTTGYLTPANMKSWQAEEKHMGFYFILYLASSIFFLIYFAFHW